MMNCGSDLLGMESMWDLLSVSTVKVMRYTFRGTNTVIVIFVKASAPFCLEEFCCPRRQTGSLKIFLFEEM